ncbi:MAG: hypothetical protein R3E53_07380 [Myxococcota bacterium]
MPRSRHHFDPRYGEGYTKGRAEGGARLALRGRRHEVTITSVLANRGLGERQMQALEESLRKLDRLRRPHSNHAVNDIERLSSAEWQAFTGAGEAPGQDPPRRDVRPRDLPRRVRRVRP